MYEQYKTAQKKFWHPMSSAAPAQRSKTLIIVKGEGNYITDVDGQRVLDGVGGLWNVNVGHNRASVKAAIAAQLGSRGWGVAPDVLCLAKGITAGYIPMGATVFNQRIAEAIENGPGFSSVIMHDHALATCR